MANEKKVDPFKPQQPQIPGVRAKNDQERSREKAPADARVPNSTKAFPVWIAAALGIIVVMIVAGAWWARGSSHKEAAAATPEAAPNDLLNAGPMKPISRLPVSPPGAIATTEELSKPWAARQFLFHNAATNAEIPALAVHLPGGAYWGISLREPFGTCQLEYVTDLERLQSQFHFRASHPMVVDPCNGTVYDLLRYGSSPDGLVRGEIEQGNGVRPPVAIEIHTRGKEVVAGRIE